MGVLHKKGLFVVLFSALILPALTQAEIIYQDDFENTTINSTYWVLQAQPWTPDHLLPVTTTDQKYNGNRSAFFETYGRADMGERSEVAAASGQHWSTSYPYQNMTYGVDYWIGFAARYTAGFIDPSGTDRWINSPFQVHVAGNFVTCPTPTTNYNTMQLYLTSSGLPHWYTVHISEPECERLSRNLYMQADLTDGSWHTYVIHIRAGYETTHNPKFEMWVDGTKQTFTINGQTVSIDTRPNCGYMTSGPFWKMGIYAHQEQRQGVYIDAFTAVRQTSGQTDAQAYAEASPTGGSTNQSPTCSIDTPTTTQNITESDSVNFTATDADSDGTIASRLWNFDGGATNSTSQDPGSTQFNTAGAYDVVYTVTDNDGATCNDSVLINVGTTGECVDDGDCEVDENCVSSVCVPDPIYGIINEWEFETGAITTDSQANTALTNNGSIAVDGGTNEPDPPGYGSYGAVFNGTSQWFSVTEGNVHASFPFQSSTPSGTIVQFFRTPSAWDSDNMYMLNRHGQSADERNFGTALAASNGSPLLLVGVNSGASVETFPMTEVLNVSTDYKLIWAINSTTGAIRGRLYSGGVMLDEATGTISGTMNRTNLPDLAIGRRVDGAYKYFEGVIYYAAAFNDAWTGSEMDDYAGIGQGTGDSEVSVNTGGGVPQILLETGANDLVCSYGATIGTDTLYFSGTVSAASGHTSATPVQVQSASIDENGGSITGTGTPTIVSSALVGLTLGDGDTVSVLVEFSGTGAVSLTLPTEGTEGSLSYQSPFWIDTASATFTSMQVVDCTTESQIARDLRLAVGDRLCVALSLAQDHYVSGGNPANLALPFPLDVGSIQTVYRSGDYSSKIILSTTIEVGLLETSNLTLSGVDDLIRNNLGTQVDIVDLGDNEISSYNVSQLTADDTYTVKIDSRRRATSGQAGSGSITIKQ